MPCISDGYLFLQHFVQFMGFDELIRDNDLTIFFDGCMILLFEDVVLVSVLFCEATFCWLLGKHHLTIFKEGLLGFAPNRGVLLRRVIRIGDYICMLGGNT